MRYGPVVILASMALALGACGGDDESDSGDSASTGTTTAETAPAETTATETTEAEAPEGEGTGEKYPAQARRNFLRACEGQGAKRSVCECSLEALEERYTFDEFRDLERRGPKSGEIEQALDEIAQDCAREG
jgi:hypothetical protein